MTPDDQTPSALLGIATILFWLFICLLGTGIVGLFLIYGKG